MNQIKDEKIKYSQSDLGLNDPAETTENRNDPDSGFRLKVLDCIFMGKKEPIVHRHLTTSSPKGNDCSPERQQVF